MTILKSRLTGIIKGRVQGVGFRYFVLEKAQLLELSGWVRNRYDDSVEFLAEGEQKEIELFLAYLKKGPPMAFVTNVEITWSDATGEFNRFSVLNTQ